MFIYVIYEYIGNINIIKISTFIIKKKFFFTSSYFLNKAKLKELYKKKDKIQRKSYQKHLALGHSFSYKWKGRETKKRKKEERETKKNKTTTKEIVNGGRKKQNQGNLKKIEN